MRIRLIWILFLAALAEPAIAAWMTWSDVRALERHAAAARLGVPLRRLARADLPALLLAGMLTAALLLLLLAEVRRERSRRRHSQRRARAIERQYRLLFHHNPHPMWVYDLETLRFLAVNAAAVRRYGYRQHEFLAMTIADIRPAEDVPRLIHDVRSAPPEARDGAIWRHRKKDGTLISVEIYSHALRFMKRPSRLILAQDVTARLAAEAQVRHMNVELEQRVRERTAELESVNAELEGFSYSVAHDLRAPLRGMDGFSQALLEDYARQLDDTALDYLRRIRSGAQRMGRLIDDLLELARVSRAEMRRVPVNLSAMVRAVMQELRSGDQDRELDLVVEEGLQHPGDPALLRIVLTNLLGNAWKFTARRERPRIETGRLVAASQGQGPAVFYVRDNGAGFDMSYAHKLFRPFQRLHATSEFPGTGIGLAIVQRVIRRHGGHVWIEGAPEKGATAYFTLAPGEPTTQAGGSQDGEPVRSVSGRQSR